MTYYIKDKKIEKAPIKIDGETQVVEKVKQEDGTEKQIKKKIKTTTFTNDQKLILAAGYVVYTPVKKQIPITSMRFNKRKIKNKLVQLGFWNIIKSTLTEDEYEDLILSEDFAFDDPLFVKCYQMLKTKIQNIDDLLKSCRK